MSARNCLRGKKDIWPELCMESYQDNIPFAFSTPKLPAISTGGLVTGPDGFFQASSSSEWAGSLRRDIDHAINVTGRVRTQDIAQLHKELVKLIILVLQPNSSKQAWQDLKFALDSMQPYVGFLSPGSGRVGLAFQTQHYVERLYALYEAEEKALADLDILVSLEKVFPNELAAVRTKFGQADYDKFFQLSYENRNPNKKTFFADTTLNTIVPMRRSVTMDLPDGRNPYTLIRRGDEPELYFRPRPLTLTDFKKSIPVVAGEMNMKESSWNQQQSSVVTALAVELSPPSSPLEKPSKKWVPLPADDLDMESEGKRSLPASPRKAKPEFKSITGQEAVQLFLTDRHLHKVKFHYFNRAKSWLYRPYDLISVPRDQVNPEHFIFSSFGVLHVYPNGSTSDIMSLAEWNREAILWNVVSMLGFFKNFLICKAFQHWRITVRRQRLIRSRSYLRLNLLPAIPEFGSALLHISRLVGELYDLEMLPNESSTTVNFTLLAFEVEVSKKKKDSEDMLSLFFRYCKKVVDVTRQRCFDQLKHYEYQTKHSKSIFSKESLYLQKKKQQVRNMNLENARQAIRQLASFITLVDQIISVHLVEVLRSAVRRYVYGVLSSMDQDSDESLTELDEDVPPSVSTSKGHPSTHSTKGDSITRHSVVKDDIRRSVFVTRLVFNPKTFELEMSPSHAKFKEVIGSCINDAILNVCDKAYSMNISGKPTGKQDSVPVSVDSAPSSASDRSLVDSLSSEIDGNETYAEAEPQDEYVIADDKGFEEPVMESKEMPTKENDEMGVATPNFVVSPEPGTRFGLAVESEGIVGQYYPLDQSKLKNKLVNDLEIRDACLQQKNIVDYALREVEWFCREHNAWIASIRAFTSSWSHAVLNEWRQKPAREIENMLNQIKAWTDRVKNVDRSLLCSNRLLLVDCRAPQTELVPALTSIFKRLIVLVADNAKNLSLEVTTDAKESIKVLENKDLNMKSFAAYARKVTECLVMKTEMSDKVTYIRSLYEVVRMTHRQLTHEEEKMDEKVKTAWETFLFQLKDALNFVSNQRPIILKQLDDKFREQYSLIQTLCKHGSSGCMIDPTRNPPEVISELKGLIAKFYNCRRQLYDLSNCRESVIGESYDLSQLDGMARVLEDRLELWKFVSLSAQTLRDWKNTLFRRFNVNLALNKINDWRKALDKLQKHLPKDDAVLLAWQQNMKEFACELPYLQQLSDEAIKFRHWKQIFTGMGESFEPSWTFTVNDLILYKLSEHSKLINQVYHSATAEFALEQMLQHIKSKWEARQFNLAKHIYITKTTVRLVENQSATKLQNSRISRSRGTRRIVNPLTKIVNQEKDSDTYTLVGADELQSELADSHVALQGMLQSRHAAEVRGEAEIWSDTLQQIGEIVSLWTSCQDKWMYLNQVFFGQPNVTRNFAHQLSKFAGVDRRYREFIRTMIHDPKVLSVLSRRHGWRELQGENLRKHLIHVISLEEELLSSISYLLEEFRSQFPRMYFLCDEDCSRLLALSRHPRSMLPYIRKCFRGVRSVVYQLPLLSAESLPTGIGSSMNHLDLELHSHKLQVTHIQGHNGEYVAFRTPLATHSEATTWMKLFEEKLHQSVGIALQDLIRLRLKGDEQSPMEVLEEVSRTLLDADRDVNFDELEECQFRHWLLRYPNQVILLSESILLSHTIKNLLADGGEKAEYEEVKRSLQHKIKQLSNVVLENAKNLSSSSVSARLQSTLSSMIALLIYYRDILQRLQLNDVTSIHSFEWQRIIKHAMDPQQHQLSFAERKGDSFGECICNVEHMGEYVATYALEYASPRIEEKNGMLLNNPIAVTPLVERSMFSLCLAMRVGKCGTLVGLEGTGKSHILTQLSSVFGRPLINLNCDEELSINMLNRSLCGAVESGSWLCLDKAHCLRPNILSFLAQQIRHVQLSYRMLLKSFKSQYSAWIEDTRYVTTSMKRSSSIPSLHSFKPSNGLGKNDYPEVSQHDLCKLYGSKEEGFYFFSHQRPQYLGSIIFNGRLLQAKPNYGIFMTLNANSGEMPEVPHNLKLVYRAIALIKIDTKKIVEVWLQSAGFSNYGVLADKLCFAREMVNGLSENIDSTEQNSAKILRVTVANLSSVIALASACNAAASCQYHSRANSVDGSSSSRRSSVSSSASGSGAGGRRTSRHSETALIRHGEELAVVNSLVVVLSAKLSSSTAIAKLKDALRTVFPLASRPMSATDQDKILSDAVSQQFQIDGLHTEAFLVEKTVQLNTALNLKQPVIILGPAGCGKTTIYKTLARTLNKLYAEGKKRRSEMDLKFEANLSEEYQMESGEVLQPSGLHSRQDSPASITGGNRYSLFSSERLEKIDISVLYPNTLRTEDLFGGFDPDTNLWQEGLLSKILKSAVCGKGDDSKVVGANQQKVTKPNQHSADDKTTDKIQKWIVMDCELHPPWIETLSCLFDINKSVRLSNMDDLDPAQSMNMIFEATDIAFASPAILSRCAVVHVNGFNQWQFVLDTWLDSAYGEYAVTKRTIAVWRELLGDLIPGTLGFIQRIGRDVLQCGMTFDQKHENSACCGVQQATSFIQILSSLLLIHLQRKSKEDQDLVDSGDKNDSSDRMRSAVVSVATDVDIQSTMTAASSNRSRLDDTIPDSNHQLALNLFGFAYVWAYGGKLLERDMKGFDVFFRHLLEKSRHDIQFPPYETVFEYYVDEDTGHFNSWEDKVDLRPRVPCTGAYYANIHQNERYSYLSNVLLKAQCPILFVGEAGCGKSSLVANVLSEEHEMTKISMSRGLTSYNLQKIIEVRASPLLKQHNLGLMAHPTAVIDTRSEEKHKILFFLDDLSCASALPSRDASSSKIQTGHELIRQIMSFGGVYDRERKLIKTLEADINFIAAATILANPGSGHGYSTHLISPRLTRLFTVIHFLQPAKETILSVYHNAVQSWLEEFPAYSLTRHYDLSQAIIAGAVELYSVVKTHLRPSPRNPHYVFSLHDIAHIMQGLFLLTPRARGRPMPKRRRGIGGREEAGGGNILQRPGGGRAGGRLRAMRGRGEVSHGGIPPMMRTVIRVWLHECSRTFYDRLSNNSDRQWFSGSLQALLKKHFCTAKDERGISPGIERVRIIKTPIPSAGGSPLPIMARDSNTSTDNDGTLFSESNDEQRENFVMDEESSSPEYGNQIEDNIAVGSTTTYQQDETERNSSAMDRLTPAAISELHSVKGWDQNDLDNSQESSLATSSRMPVNVALSPQPLMTVDERRSESVVDSVFDSNDGADETTEMRNMRSVSDANEDISEGDVDTKFSSESVSDGEEYDSRATSYMETKTEDDDENRSLTTAMTTELETDTSEYSADDSDENIESTTTTETPSTMSKAGQKEKSRKETNKLSFTGDAPEPSAARVVKRTQSRPQPARPGGAKLGVTFIPGLIDDPDRLVNTAGPLAELGQILSQSEDPTEIIFSRSILCAVEGGTEGYSESTSGQLATALKIAQDTYNSDFNSYLDLVYFNKAVSHAAKLSRIISTQHEGHALLLSSTRYSGRRSLTRLVSYLCKAKLFECQREFSNDRTNAQIITEKRTYLKSVIIEASMCAGIKNELTVLLVDECFTSDEDCLGDICSVVKDGQSPSLYSHDALATIAAEIMPGTAPSALTPDSLNRSGSAIDKLDHCLEFYFQRVVSNLHVVLLMPFCSLQGPHDLSNLNKNITSCYFCDREELHDFHQILRKCPDLLTRFSSVDLYEPWDHLAWTEIGEKHIEDFCGVLNEFRPVGKVKIPWPSDLPLDHQITNLCRVMSFIHLDALERTKQSIPRFADKIVTPSKFRMMVDLFVNIAVKVGRDERKTLKRYEQVLKKVRDAETSVDRYGRDKESLLPRLGTARDTERAWKRHVEQERREYIEARQRCDLEEEIIEELEKEVEFLKEDSKLAFNKVNPMYQTALHAMDSLTVHYLNEIKSYKKPPQSAVVVVSALCDMFSVKPANWENGRALLMKDNFFEELEFYDKDNIPEDVYVKLSDHVKNPDFQPSYVQNGSIAAFSLCQWMHAVHSYAKMSRYLAPKIAKLKEAEAKMIQAQATLGAKRVRCNQIKDELDSKIEQHKMASHAVRQFEKELKNLEAKIAKAQMLMGNLSEYVAQWRHERDMTLSRLDCAVGDSLLTAACSTYHGVLGEKQRNQSLTLWKQACETGVVDLELGILVVSKNSERSESTTSNGHVDPTSPAPPHKGAGSPSNTSGTDTLTWDDIDEGTSLTSSKETRSGVFVKISGDFNVFKLLGTESITRAWHRAGLPRDEQMRSNVLYLLSSALYQETCYPLAFDPDEQLQSWMKTIAKNYLKLKHKKEKSAAEDFVDSPEPSTAEQTRSGELSIFDDDETASFDDGTRDYTSSYFDDGESTVISVTSTSQTMRSGGTSRKPSHARSSRKSKGVRFADNQQVATSPALPLQNEEEKADVSETRPELPVDDLKEKQSHSRSSSGVQAANLVICGADDGAASEILGDAVANGFILLITHLERAPHSLLYSISLITQRMRNKGNDGSSSLGKSSSASSSVPGGINNRIADVADSFNPNFRLFLSAGVNVGFVDNRALPMNFFGCVSFALRDQALEEKLLQIVVTQEKPEFESHHRLLEADIFHLEEEMENLKNNLLIKVSIIEGAILADVTLLDAIRSCKRETLATLASLQETKIMETNLLSKKIELAQVASQGRAVYDCLVGTSALKPNIYHWNAKKFIDIFVSSLKSRIRGKSSINNDAVASQGSVLLKSRVVELNQAVLESVLRRVKRTMYHNDVLIFTTFVTLAQLIREDRMNEEEVNSLLLGTSDYAISKLKPSAGKGVAVNKPRWMSDDIWFSARKLEQKHKSTFAGLTSSLSRNQKRWKEYLHSEPVFLSNVPCEDLIHLSVGQKALLWKELRPDIGSTIVSELGACVLGRIASEVSVWNVRELLESVPQQNPIIFLIPEKGSTYQPTVDIANEAERRNISFIERSAPFEDDISDVMKECMSNGYWLFLHNCELARSWSADVLDLLYSVTTSNFEADDVGSGRPHSVNKDEELAAEEATARSISTTTEEILESRSTSKLSDSVKVEQINTRRTVVHESFRLWLITTEGEFNVKSLFPGILLQHSEIVNLVFPLNHRELIKQKYVQLNNEDLSSPSSSGTPDRKRPGSPADLRDLKLRLSLFHAVFQQKLMHYPSKYLGHTDEDVLDVYKCCRRFVGNPGSEVVVKRICSELLSNSIFDQRITEAMTYFLEECFVPAEMLFDYVHRPRNKHLAEDLRGLLVSMKNRDQGFDSLSPRIHLTKLDLPIGAESLSSRATSITLINDMKTAVTYGLTSAGNKVYVSKDSLLTAREVMLKRRLEGLHGQIFSTEFVNPDCVTTPKQSPITDFYRSEISNFNRALSLLRQDITLMIDAVKGLSELNPTILNMLEKTRHDKIPDNWVKIHPQIFRYYKDTKLSAFILLLQESAALIQKYTQTTSLTREPSEDNDVDESNKPLSSDKRCSSATQTRTAYNPSAFFQPHMFLRSVLAEVARSKYHDAQRYHFKVEVTSKLYCHDERTHSSPMESILLDGLWLQNAYYDESFLTIHETTTVKLQKLPPVLITVERIPVPDRHNKTGKSRDDQWYQCPVFVGAFEADDVVTSNDALLYIPIKSDVDPEVLRMKNARVVSYMSS